MFRRMRHPQSALDISLQPYLEHTLLKPDASDKDVLRTLNEACEHGFLGICIASSWVPLVRESLRRMNTKVDPIIVAVVGFPHGNATTGAKVAEAFKAIDGGAKEIDMVMHIGRFKSGDMAGVVSDIAAVVVASKSVGGNAVKVIIETGYLSDQEIAMACGLVTDAKADFVKTSTGFGPRGASVHDVQLIKSVVGGRLGIKAAGGIRNATQAWDLIAAGATRIGASSSVQLVTDKRDLIDTGY